MLNGHLPRSAGSARLLVQYGVESGISASACLKGTGLSEDDISDPSAEITTAQEHAIVHNLVREHGSESYLGLDIGSRYSVSLFGMLGFACMSAPTLRSTIEVSLRYQDLAFTLAQASLVTRHEQTFIVIDVSHLGPEIHRFVVEHCMATVWAAILEMDDQPPRPTLDLAYRRPANSARYRTFFGVEPNFGAPTHRLGFPNSDLDRPRPQVDLAALELCEQQCQALLRRRQDHVGTVGLVRDRLTRATGARPSVETIASDLHMSSRTLRRALAAENSSFRELNEQVRQQRAAELLDEGLPIGEIATQVGYATSSGFVHAYQAWHGATPGAHRRKARNP